MTQPRRGRIGLRFAQAGGALMILGGAADLTIRQLLPAHREFLGFMTDPVPPATEMLVLALLHALGAALIAAGLAVLVLLREARISGRSAPAFAAAGIAVLAEGTNAAGIHSIGSRLFVAPLIFILLVLVGVALFTSAETDSAVGRRSNLPGMSG